MLTWRDMPNKITVKRVSVSASGNSPEHDDLPVPGDGRKIKDVGTDELRAAAETALLQFGDNAAKDQNGVPAFCRRNLVFFAVGT